MNTNFMYLSVFLDQLPEAHRRLERYIVEQDLDFDVGEPLSDSVTQCPGCEPGGSKCGYHELPDAQDAWEAEYRSRIEY